MNLEVEVLRPETQRFEQAKSRAVEQAGNEQRHAAELCENGFDLTSCEDHREAHRLAGVLNLSDPRQLEIQHAAVQEEQRRERLVLSRRGDVAIRGQMGKEAANLPGSHVPRVALAVVENEPSHPANIGLLGPQAQMSQPSGLTDLIQELGRGHGSLAVRAGRASPYATDRPTRYGGLSGRPLQSGSLALQPHNPFEERDSWPGRYSRETH